jgi:hypothetical protein
VTRDDVALRAAGDLSLADRGDIVSRSASRGGSANAEAQAAAQATAQKARVRKAAARAAAHRQAQRQAREKARQADLRATRRAVAGVDTKLWTTTELNLWTEPAAGARRVGLLDDGKQVLVTGREADGRVEVVVGGAARWVTAGYLDNDKPEPGVGGTCTNGTGVSSGVSPSIVKVHEAVCASFPSISTYGYFRGGETDHATGHAVDIMISGAAGWDVANFVRANAGALGVSYVIYAQHIWSVQRSGEGWRGMPDRGSTTANHYDHVHVSVS